MRLTVNDIGTMEYSLAWEIQRGLFNKLIEEKFETRGDIVTAAMPEQYLIFVEHPHVYTLGKNGYAHNLLINKEFLEEIGATYFHIDRGGDVTYHGYGQLVGYPIIDLEQVKMGVKEYIYNLEEATIRTIAEYGIVGERDERAIGVWIDANKESARKICAIGVKTSRFVTMHGFALNVSTDLAYFNYINPCGFVDKGVTSIEKEINNAPALAEVSLRFEKHFRDIFRF